jgi:hypothetical protein
MKIASNFIQMVIVLIVPPLLYSLCAIYISNSSMKFRWTQREVSWTKARDDLVAKGAGACASCKAAISVAAGSLGRSCAGIRAAYLTRIREIHLTRIREICAPAVSTLLPRALWCRGCTRRLGRGSVPQDAATRIHLKPTQQRGLAPLETGEWRELTRGQYEEIAGVSRSQAAYDLAELVEGGILQRVGGGRSTRYRLARESRPGQRHWTNDRIDAELREFCAGRKGWPSAGEFKAAGRADLYVAASRYGGIGFWAAELGFPRPGRASQPRETSLRRKFAWAGAGALASAALVATAAAVVVLNLPRQSLRAVAPIRIAPAAASDESRHVQRKNRTPARPVRKTVRQTHRHAAQQVEKAATREASPSTSAASLIAERTYSPASTSASSVTHTSYRSVPARTGGSAPAPTTSGGPAPLRAPLTASAPTPLKAP